MSLKSPPDAHGDAAPAVTLTAAVLLNLLARYDIALIPHVVGPARQRRTPTRAPGSVMPATAQAHGRCLSGVAIDHVAQSSWYAFRATWPACDARK